MNIPKVLSYNHFLFFFYRELNIATLLDLENGKNDKISHRADIYYLGLKGLTPKQVHQDMEATLGEDAPSYSMVKKWAG